MKREMKYITIGAMLMLIMFAAPAAAAPIWRNFQNEYATDAVYFFITSGSVTFMDVDEKQLEPSWTMDTFESNRLVFSGNELSAGSGDFRIRFSDKAAFVIEWANVLDGAINQSGTMTFDAKGKLASSVYGPITSAVPIPESAWLLGSALICFVGIRRKTLKS